MKSIIISFFSIVFVFDFQTSLKSQTADTVYLAYNETSSEQNFQSPSLISKDKAFIIRKDGTIINMEMVNSFKHNYDKIDTFSFYDFIKGDPSFLSLKYVAFRRVRMNDNGSMMDAVVKEMASLKSELSVPISTERKMVYFEESIPQRNNKSEKVENISKESFGNEQKTKEKKSVLKWIKF